MHTYHVKPTQRQLEKKRAKHNRLVRLLRVFIREQLKESQDPPLEAPRDLIHHIKF